MVRSAWDLTKYYFCGLVRLMRLTQKGQVTVPKRMREQFGLGVGVEVEFEATDLGLLIRPRKDLQAERLQAGIRAVRGTADSGLDTGAILKMTRG